MPKLYHGSPHRLDEIRPATATGKGDASAREHAIYLANNPEEARLYALIRPRNNKRKGWAILDNKVHYVKGDPINKQGYVYEHEFDDYEDPPESDPGIGYRVYGAYKPAKRKRVRLKGMEDRFVEHPDKASYKDAVKSWLASREKTSSVKHTFVTGHSGAGKTTLSKRLAEQRGLPIYELDKDPDIVEQLERQKAYIKAHGGLDRGANARLPTGPEWDIPFQRASEAGINRALALKTPHVIEGTYLLDRDPKSLRDHELHLVDTPEELVLNRRVERQRLKDIARGRYWGGDRAAGVRLRGQQLIDENKQGAARWRKAGYVKKASKEVRIGSKVYRPKVQAFMYDDQGRILAAKSQASGSGLRAFNNYKFPGGGIEAGEDVAAAARKELLEEAGYEAGGDMFEFGTPTAVDWDKKFRRQARKKGRGRYAGQYEYYAAGPIGKRNTSLLGSEGDALGGMEFVPMSKLQRDLKRTAGDPDNEYAYFDKQKLVALRQLKDELGRRGVKTASLKKDLRNLLYHKFVEPILENNVPRIKETAEQLRDFKDAENLDLIREHMARGGDVSRRRFLRYMAQEALDAQDPHKHGYIENIARTMDQQHDSYSTGEQARELFGTALGHTPYGAIPGALLTNTGNVGMLMAVERPGVDLAQAVERAAGRGYKPLSVKARVTKAVDDLANKADDFAAQVEAFNKGDNAQQGLVRAGIEKAKQGVNQALDDNAKKYGYSTAESVGDFVLQQVPVGQTVSAMNRAIRVAERKQRNAALPPGVKPPRTRAELRRYRKQKDRNRLSALALGLKMRYGALKPMRKNVDPSAMTKQSGFIPEVVRHHAYLRKALPEDFGQAANRYYQTRGQEQLIGYGKGRYQEHRSPRTKRERRMEDVYQHKVAQKGVATKTDPAKWARAKAQARAKMGGKHSARAMQLATQIYKKSGGGYRGKKPSSGTNKLKKWTKQKWQWSGKDKPGQGGTGVYLPKRSSEQLRSTRAGRDKLRAASAAKRAATAAGKQFSSHGLHVGKRRSAVR